MSYNQFIKSIHIEKLKGIKDLTIDFEGSRVTGIFGENGCGKSTILHALMCVYKPKIYEASEKRPNISSSMTRYSDFFKRTSIGHWKGSRFDATVSFGDKNVDKERKVRYKKEGRWFPAYKNKPDREVFFIGINWCLPDIEQASHHKTMIYLGSEYALNHAEQIAEQASYILNRKYIMIVGRKAHKQTYLSAQRDDTCYDSLSMGAGEQRLFRILETLYNVPKYSLIVIDEVDLTLHTRALNRLVDLMVKLADEKQLQIVFTSHRESLLSRTDINIRHILSTPTATLCFERTTPECMLRLTGEMPKEFDFFVEDDLAEMMISELLVENSLRQRAFIHRFGAAENAYLVASTLDIVGQLDERTFIVLDGDVDCSREDKIAKVHKKLSGTERNKEERVKNIVDHIHQFVLPANTSPEEYVHAVLCASSDDNDIIRAAKSIQCVVDKHEYLDGIIRALGMPRAFGLHAIIVEFKKNTAEWKKYTSAIQTWIDSVVENTLP